ncbi:peptide ABC transporter substrate-binding protein [Niveispirillum fermenti]|uniref:peptide ABC transporter substrate-binding protein n=1 Tax=Niveispirillum fermenti TaxID=1233113 RepID=UPI003A894E11
MRHLLVKFLSVLLALSWLGVAATPAETALHRGNGSEPETLDPHKSTGEAESWIEMDLFEGLVTADAQGQVIPGAALAWTISPDRLTCTFTLRPDGKWSDGTPVTAGDFVFSWRRLVSPDTRSRYAFFLWPVKNAEAISKGRMPATALGAEAVDDLTLRVTLEAPTSYFIASLQHHATYAVSQANVKRFGDDFIRPGNLVSNGAFMLAEAVPQGHVKLVRNPHFHAAGDVALDAVYFYPTENRDAELKRFRAGELDITYDIPDGQIAWTRQNMPGQMRLAPFFSTYWFVYNLRNEPWKSSPQLRAALSMAIDRQLIVDKITQAGEIAAYTVTPPGTDNYKAPLPDWASLTQAERDDRARALLAEAGYGPGGRPLEVELLYNTSENHRKIAIAIDSMWRQKLGVRARLVNQEWKVLLQNRAEGRFRDVVRGGWIGDYNDAYSFLSLFLSDVKGQNHAGYASPDFDRLVKAAASEIDPRARRSLMERAEAQLLADHVVIPVYVHVTTHMVSDRVRGWHDNVRNLHLSRYLSVER